MVARVLEYFYMPFWNQGKKEVTCWRFRFSRGKIEYGHLEMDLDKPTGF